MHLLWSLRSFFAKWLMVGQNRIFRWKLIAPIWTLLIDNKTYFLKCTLSIYRMTRTSCLVSPFRISCVMASRMCKTISFILPSFKATRAHISRVYKPSSENSDSRSSSFLLRASTIYKIKFLKFYYWLFDDSSSLISTKLQTSFGSVSGIAT